MSGPITWRSLMNVSLQDAERPLVSSANLFSSGFDRLQKSVTDWEGGEAKIADRQDDKLALAFKEKLLTAKTPEERAAMQAELDGMTSNMGLRARTATLGEAEKRDAFLRTDVVAQRLFKDNTTEYENRGDVQEAFALGAQGKTKEALEKIAHLKGKLPRYGEHVAAIEKGGREIESHNVGMQKIWADIQKGIEDSATAKENAKANNKSADAAQSQAHTARINMQLTRLDQLVRSNSEMGAKLAAPAAGTIGNPKDHEQLVKDLTVVVGDKAKAEKVVQAAASAITSNPKYANLPTQVVIDTVLKNIDGVSTGWWSNTFGDGGVTSTGKKIAEQLEAASASKEVRDFQGRIEAGRRDTSANVMVGEGVANRLRGELYPELRTPDARPGVPGAPTAAPGAVPGATAGKWTGPEPGRTPTAAEVERAKWTGPLGSNPADAGDPNVPAPAVVLPKPTAPAGYAPPADSPAGRSLARREEAAAKAVAAETKARTEATSAASDALKDRSPTAASKVQDMPGFNLLDSKTKSQIWQLVNKG